MGELVVRGGTVVLPSGPCRADVLVRDKVIAAVGSLPETSLPTVDASGAYGVPGGVDAHVHFQTPQGRFHTHDDFTSGTAAAAFGGTTTAMQFCVQEPGERFADTLARWRGLLAAAPPYVDVGFHLMVTDLPGGTASDLLALPGAGVTSVKVFMANEPAIPAGDLFRVMQAAARTGARVMVHAEDGEAIEVLVGDALAAGHVEPRRHSDTRPPPTETAAALRAMEYGRLTGARLYFVHVTAAATVRAIARAREEGLDVVGETCPQYLLLDPDCLAGEQGARMAFTPPPREAAERQALWRGLADGALSVLASDHNTFCLADKAGAADFTGIPQGIPGIEHRLLLAHHLGVRTGRLSWARFVEVTAAGPARALDLWPRKGVIAPGSDADLVVFDPRRPQSLSAAGHHMASDFSAYEGVEAVGSPRTVVAGGRVVVHDGELVGEPGAGRYLHRTTRRDPPGGQQ